MLEDTLKLTHEGMEKALERLQRELSRVRAGRANPAMLDELKVESYGTMLPLKQAGTVSVADARMLVIKPYDRNTISAIERAINASQLGLNPQSDGVVVRVPIPPLTEERRKQLVKQVHDFGEDAKIAVRQVRRDCNLLLKEAEKAKALSEDDCKRGMERIQEVTDSYAKKVEETIAKKEAEIMEG